MSDLFETRTISPMLLTEGVPFDSEDYIYELKLDGIRAVCYLEPGKTDIRNKRNKMVIETYPELKDLFKRTKKRCIIDGELIVLNHGKPDFFEVQRRSLMTDPFKIELSSKQKPVRFVAYDIIYVDDKQITDLPLLERKKILENTIIEDEELAITRYIYHQGIEFYNLAASENLEGVVAKKKDSFYYFGKRSKDWVKFKKMYDSDFVICGYVPSDMGGIKSLVLGAYKDQVLYDQGHVSLGISKEDEAIILKFVGTHEIKRPFNDEKATNDTVYCQPELVCTVKYMMRMESGALRQPVYKGLRNDKDPKDCVIT